MTATPAEVNGWPGLVIRLDGEVDSVVSLRVEDGLVTALYTVRNPEKLTALLAGASLTR
jgi:RNA polymerase sigma-70 factor (ECF subfamily)